MRIMGLDYGSKTVGVAISDALRPVSYTHLRAHETSADLREDRGTDQKV